MDLFTPSNLPETAYYAFVVFISERVTRGTPADNGAFTTALALLNIDKLW